MSHHRPRPGLRLRTAQAGAAVQAPAPAGYGRSSPSGSASAPRSRSPSVRGGGASNEQSAEPVPPPPSSSLAARPPASRPPPRPPPPRPGGGARDRSGPTGRGPRAPLPKLRAPLLSSHHPGPGYTGRPPAWLFPLHLSHPSLRLGPLPNSLPNLIQTPVPTLPPGKSRLEKCLHQCLLPWASVPPDPSSSRQDPQVARVALPSHCAPGEVHPSPSGRSRRAVSLCGRS